MKPSGPGAAVAPLLRNGPQRSWHSAGTMLGFMPLFVSPAKAGAQEPRWCRCHSTDPSAVGIPPARCLSSLEEQHPPCRRALGGPMSFDLQTDAPGAMGSVDRLLFLGGKSSGR